jgi:hypothetical protein
MPRARRPRQFSWSQEGRERRIRLADQPRRKRCQFATEKEKGYISIPPEGLLKLSRAFSATLRGKFGMGTVRMGAVVRW